MYCHLYITRYIIIYCCVNDCIYFYHFTYISHCILSPHTMYLNTVYTNNTISYLSNLNINFSHRRKYSLVHTAVFEPSCFPTVGGGSNILTHTSYGTP